MKPSSGTKIEVKREDLARKLAERSLVSQGEAQDELDRVVHGVIKNLRRGGAAEMPGVGKLTAKLPGSNRTKRREPPAPEARTVTASQARDRIAEIVRESLAAGHAVEIEGLGTFRASHGEYEFAPQTVAEVFIAYAAEDLSIVRHLCAALRAEGCSPWLDKEKLLAGQNWPRAIERAIEVSDVFVACFSPRSVVKRGMFQQELRHALACARRRPLDDLFLIPVRFAACDVPRPVANHLQYVDLFPDWDKGVRRLARAIRKAARRRPIAGLA